jgi:hypothetical protein
MNWLAEFISYTVAFIVLLMAVGYALHVTSLQYPEKEEDYDNDNRLDD